jgi:hypothetical protein
VTENRGKTERRWRNRKESAERVERVARRRKAESKPAKMLERVKMEFALLLAVYMITIKLQLNGIPERWALDD